MLSVEIYDIIMLVVLAGAMIFGAIKGFAWQLASIASILISYIVAYRFREPFSESIQAEPPWNRFLAMLILYVGTSLIVWVAFRMISGTIDRLKLREFDRQIGAMFGLAKGALYCTLITLFAVTLFGERTRETVVSSKSGRYIAHVLDRSESVIPPEIHEVVGPYLEKFNRRFHEAGDGLGQAVQSIADEGGNRPGNPWTDGSISRRDAAPPPPFDPQAWSPQPPQQARQPTFNGWQR